MPSKNTTDAESKFWSMVDVSGECWTWQGSVTRSGYGLFYIDGTRVYAHRFAHEIENGPISDGLQVCHHCDNPSCVRAEHLFAGTASDNARDRERKGRGSAGKPLTDNDVRFIRAANHNGKANRVALARQFGVSYSQVGKIINRHAYKWVD